MRVNSSPFHAGDIQKCRIPAWSFKSLRLSPGWMNYRNSCDNPLEWAFFRAEVNVGHHLTSSSADLSSSFPDCPLPWLVWIMWLSRDQLPPSPPPPRIRAGTLTAFSLLQQERTKAIEKQFLCDCVLLGPQVHAPRSDCQRHRVSATRGSQMPAEWAWLALRWACTHLNSYHELERLRSSWRR